MALGLLVYDLLFLLSAVVVYGSALEVARNVFVRVEPLIGPLLAVFPSIVAALLTTVAVVGVLSGCCPRLKPGRYKMMGPVFFVWILRSMFRRLLWVPGLRFILLSSNVLRFFTLRALGAKVAFTANMSNDVDLFDPCLLEVGPGATIGSRTLISGHYIEHGKLVLGAVRIRAGALLAAEVLVSPDVEIAAGAVLQPRAVVGPGCRIGEKAVLGGATGLANNVVVGARAKIGHGVILARNQIVADRERVPPRQEPREQ